MEQFSIFCGDCGLLVQDMQEVQEHAKATSHQKLSLSMDGSLDLFCCECDMTFRYQSQVKEHIDLKGHKKFVKTQMLDELEPGHTGYATPISPRLQKLRLETGIEMRTVKKAPKMRTEPWSPIPFEISDDEADDAFLCGIPSGYHTSPNLSDEDIATSNNQLSSGYVVMYKERSLDDLNLGVTVTSELRAKYVLAEGVSRLEALKKVDEALLSWDDEKKTFKLPGRGGAYTFDERLKQVCLNRSKPYNCASDKATRMCQVLSIIQQILRENIVLRIRSIYYLYPILHVPDLKPKKQVERISDTIGDISLMLEVTRESLNLFASPIGLITGPLLLFSNKKILVDCNLGGPSGCLIPSESVLIDEVHATSKIDYVVVLEKDTVFHYLGDHDFHKRHNCMLVTGRGQADVATRILLRKLRDSLGVPFYCLVDGNPSGAHIFCTYRFGSEEKAYDNLFLTVSDMDLIGLNLNDVDPENMTELTSNDMTMVDNLLKKRYLYPVKNLRANLVKMQEKGLEADIEVIMREQSLEDYILKQISDI